MSKKSREVIASSLDLFPDWWWFERLNIHLQRNVVVSFKWFCDYSPWVIWHFHYNIEEARSQIAGFEGDFYLTCTTIGQNWGNTTPEVIDAITLDEIRDFCCHETHFPWGVVQFVVHFKAESKTGEDVKKKIPERQRNVTRK